MKSIRITFRLHPYQLARGLRTIRQLEPKYKLLSLNDIVKTIYHDYLAKMSINRNESIPYILAEEINSFIGKSSPKSLTIDDLIEIKSEQEPKSKSDLADEILTEINQASKFNDPNETESEISSLTDFSPPKDWME